MMGVGCIGDMLNHSSFEDSAVLDALTDQPWQVNGCVDADRCKFLCIGDARC
jgi:hypothetical protein